MVPFRPSEEGGRSSDSEDGDERARGREGEDEK